MFGWGKKQKKSEEDQANEVADSNLDIANHALKIAKNTQIIGNHTLETLQEQEDQIDRFNDTLAQIEINADEGARHVGHINSVGRSIGSGILHFFCGCCISIPEEKLEKEKKKNRDIGKPKKKKHSKPDAALPSEIELTNWKIPTGNLHSEKEQHFAETIDKTNKVVKEIDGAVDGLKVQALAMSETLNKQNKKLDKGIESAKNGKNKLNKVKKKCK